MRASEYRKRSRRRQREIRRARLPWDRGVGRELGRLSWPITVSVLSYSTMTLVDTLFVGQLGAAPLAGVGLGGTASFTIMCFSLGLLRGVKVTVSHAVGAGRRSEIDAYRGAGIYLAMLLGVLTVAIGTLVVPYIEEIAATKDAGSHAGQYLAIRIFGSPIAFSYVALRECRYGEGDSRTPMKAAVIANAANIVLDYTLIFGLDFGVRGAAVATVLAQTIEGAVLVLAHRGPFGLTRARPGHIKDVARIGVPTGLQFLLEVGAFSLLAFLIAAMSEREMAAHQIAMQVIHFTFLPALAISEAASVMAGQAMGARRWDLVPRVARMSLAIATAYTALCTVVLLLLGEAIASGFTEDRELVSIAARLLLVAAVFQVFDGANAIARGVLRGAGDVMVPAAVGILTAWIFTPPLTYVLGVVLGLGALGGWIGLCAEIIVGAVVLWLRLSRGHYRRVYRERRRRERPLAHRRKPLTAAVAG